MTTLHSCDDCGWKRSVVVEKHGDRLYKIAKRLELDPKSYELCWPEHVERALLIFLETQVDLFPRTRFLCRGQDLDVYFMIDFVNGGRGQDAIAKVTFYCPDKQNIRDVVDYDGDEELSAFHCRESGDLVLPAYVDLTDGWKDEEKLRRIYGHELGHAYGHVGHGAVGLMAPGVECRLAPISADEVKVIAGKLGIC